MGRKDKFIVDYFPHNCNHGKTIFILESRFGNNGYAVWFKTLELLGASNNHFIDCRKTTDWEYMSAKMQVEPDRLQQIYNLLANLKAIDQELWENTGPDARIHPTQKPIALYKWLLKNYAKEGNTILDTHVGSGSSRIACYEMGFDFTGYEIDKDYWESQEKRFNIVKNQMKLF